MEDAGGVWGLLTALSHRALTFEDRFFEVRSIFGFAGRFQTVGWAIEDFRWRLQGGSLIVRMFGLPLRRWCRDEERRTSGRF